MKYTLNGQQNTERCLILTIISYFTVSNHQDNLKVKFWFLPLTYSNSLHRLSLTQNHIAFSLVKAEMSLSLTSLVISLEGTVSEFKTADFPFLSYLLLRVILESAVDHCLVLLVNQLFKNKETIMQLVVNWEYCWPIYLYW